MSRVHHQPQPAADAAVAAVVQRCLDAGASQVDVAVEFAGARSWIRIAAAGAVDLAPPETASPVHPSPAALDGLDLVGAGLALGSSVTVASTSRGAAGRRVSQWRLGGDGAATPVEAMQEPAPLDDAEVAAAATVVLVEGLHEVLAYKRREGRVIEAVVERLCARLVEALGLAFHRAVAGTQRRRAPLAITVNAVEVTPRDPFAAELPPLRLRRRELPFVAGGGVQAVTATPYVLAPFDADPATGRQGFFVYLRDRLVQAGGWSRLNVAGRSDGLARIAVDLPAAATGAFAWEAPARRVLFPASLVPALRALAFEAVTAVSAQPASPTGEMSTCGLAQKGTSMV